MGGTRGGLIWLGGLNFRRFILEICREVARAYLGTCHAKVQAFPSGLKPRIPPKIDNRVPNANPEDEAGRGNQWKDSSEANPKALPVTEAVCIHHLIEIKSAQ